jgi:hypothetical protein
MGKRDESGAARAGGMAWFWIPVAVIFILGVAGSVAAYLADSDLAILEAIVVGFGGVSGLIVGLLGGFIAIVAGLFGALIGIVAAGGALALTLFLAASPVLALILLYLLLREKRKNAASNAAAPVAE